MADIREAMKRISGEEPTPERVAKIQAIAHALDIPANDAMMPILVALDTYQGTFSKLPGEMKKAAEQIAQNAEATAHARITAAAAELVAKTGDKLVDTFRHELGKTLWSRSIWAGLVLLVVGIGSYAAGEIDIWWHSRKLHQLEAKEQKLREEVSTIENSPGDAPVYSCGGLPCVPILTNAQVPNIQGYTISSGKFKGTPLGVLNMNAIREIEKSSQ